MGLKIGRIVVDAGHGGHDTGTIGPNGLTEKDLVLDVALRLGRLLETRLGADVIFTRDDDTFIPLETRTAIANEHQADLFISVHANSSADPSARGVETYYLNFTSNPDALEVAARENAVSEKSIFELQDLVKKITLKEKIEESRELATRRSAVAVQRTGGQTLDPARPWRKKSTVRGADRRQHAQHPGRDLLRLQPHRRGQTGNSRVPPEDRRIALQGNRQICRRPQRGEGGVENEQARRRVSRTSSQL